MATFFGNRGNPGGVPGTKGVPVVKSFQSGESPVFEYPFAIAGITKDSTGAALGSVTVTLFRTADNSLVNQTVSDANGIYTTPASPLLDHFQVSYKAGSPDVTGATKNNLRGA